MPRTMAANLCRHKFVAGDVIPEEQAALRPAEEIVDAVIDEILPDGIPAIEAGGDFGLCANAIGEATRMGSIKFLRAAHETGRKAALVRKHRGVYVARTAPSSGQRLFAPHQCDAGLCIFALCQSYASPGDLPDIAAKLRAFKGIY